MSNLPHDKTPLEVLPAFKLSGHLSEVFPNHLNTTQKQNLLMIQFKDQKKILLAISKTTTWGQLVSALEERFNEQKPT
jgi:hypothetical protein